MRGSSSGLAPAARDRSSASGDWLPLVYPSRLREPQHRSFPKVAEAWDVDRIVRDYADAAVQTIYAGSNEIMKVIIARRLGLG